MALGPQPRKNGIPELERYLDEAISRRGGTRVVVNYAQSPYPQVEKEDWEHLLRQKYLDAGWLHAEFCNADCADIASKYFIFRIND